MNDFFDRLGAAAKRAVNSVATEVSMAAEEQKLRELYQSLGKLCYRNARTGLPQSGPEFDGWLAQIDEGIRRVRELKDRKNVAEVQTDIPAQEEDFVILEEQPE